MAVWPDWRIRLGTRGGGLVLYGTDLGNFGTAPGIDVTELELMRRAGMSELQVIHSATGAPARWLGLKERGTLAPGQVADLVLVRGVPSTTSPA